MPSKVSSRRKKPGNTIALKQTSDGLHLTNSILWFDSTGSGDLSFLSSAIQKVQPNVPQVIATEETKAILEAFRRKPNVLVCQYNRPFSIGPLKMELLPSGAVLGGASLYVETEKGRLLYAPLLQTHKIATVRQMQLKKAHTLVVGANHPDPHLPMPARKKERERLVAAVMKSLRIGEFPIILCEPIATAQEITHLLAEEAIPVAVHDSIYKINQVYESFGSKLGDYSRYVRGSSKRKVCIMPLSAGRIRLRSTLPEGPLFYVEDTYQESMRPAAMAEIRERFYMSSSCDGPELKEVIAAVQPKELYIFGPYAKRYVEELGTICGKVNPLFENEQPTLF